MTATPAIYGDLSDEAKTSYSRWIMALFDRTEHVDHCPFVCTDTEAACSEGRRVIEAEQQRWAEWHELRRLERK